MEIVSLATMVLGHKLTVAQAETSMWKNVKMRCQLLYGSRQEHQQERVISFIGVNQHIFSNLYEVLFLGASFAWMKYSGDSEKGFLIARWIVILSVLIADVAMFVLSLGPLVCCFMPGCSAQLKPASEETETKNQEPLVEGGTEKPATGLAVQLGQFFRAGLRFVVEKFVALWYGRLAVHAILQAWLLYVFTEVVEYPMSFAEASDGSADCSKHHCTPENYCSGTLTNLVLLAILGDVTYSIGALMYFVFLLRCPPNWFYRVVVPLCTLFMAAMMVSFWWVNLTPHIVAFIMLTVAVVGPTYLERYNFYYWMAVIDEKHFGFFYGIYSIGKNLLHLGVSLVLTFFGTDIKPGHWSFSTLLCICMAMMLIVCVYSSWFGYAYREHFAAQKQLQLQQQQQQNAAEYQEQARDNIRKTAINDDWNDGAEED
eukprot:TRINITY_DN3166_c0_g1_i4.p1 TRINITY_DN3166_c0_g1~~TRINITY_DN3166_c0_g1_i4.p1  ORF type:complete len:428 (-),score=35.54 TRINITY_DN3166_c0_g1_i4:69-1352(-)